MQNDEMVAGVRVVVLGVSRHRENRGSIVEVDVSDAGTVASEFVGAVVRLDDGTHCHRWSWELVRHADPLSPTQHLVWDAMRLGARRVPTADLSTRRYVGGGVDLTMAPWCDPDCDGLGPLWRAFTGEVQR